MYDLKVGDIVTRKSFRKRLSIWKKFIVRYKLLSKILNISEKDIVSERYSLLRARLFTSYAVLDYINRVENLFRHNKKMVKAIVAVRKVQQGYIKKNQKEIQHLSIDYPHLIIAYQKKVVEKLIAWK